MASTLRDLLAEPSLALDLLVDGDLDRRIRWVHVTELTDPSPYLVGEELLLTAGVWRSRGSAADFVHAVARRQAAGIGYGLLDPAEHVPTALIRACRQQVVPLVSVPVQTPFLAISQWFVDRLTADNAAVLHGTIRLTANLLAAAESEPTLAALRSVGRILGRAVGREVWITDPDGVPMSWARRQPSKGARRALVDAGAAQEPSNVQIPEEGTWSVRAVMTGRRRTALLAVEGDDDLLVRSRTEAAVPIIGLVLARERAVREAERRLSGEAISLVLSRQDELAGARLATYRLDPAERVVAVVCHVHAPEQSLSLAENWRDEADIDGVVALRGKELFAVLAGDAVERLGGALPVGTALAGRTRALGAGVSSSADGVAGLRRGLIQSQQLAALAVRHGGGTVLSDELKGRHAYLLALQDRSDVEEFRHALLGTLEAHDELHESDLLPTLRVFLESGGRWQETATRLHIHVNTLRHRLGRVQQLTGRTLDNTPDRVDLWLALQVPPG